MRKALLAAMAACAMVVPNIGNAAATEKFTIMGSTLISNPGEGDMGAPCATGGFKNDNQCQKAVFSRHARCAYLEARPQAQTGRTGQLGYVFKIDATKVRGLDLEDERDNKRLDLVVTNTLGTNVGGTAMDVPDVDVNFYATLGACASDYEGPQNIYVPLDGKGPEPLISGFVSKTKYTSLGNEMNKVFPGGSYESIDTGQLKRANVYWAIVTVVGAAGPEGTKVSMTCEPACADGWFIQV